MTKTSQYQGLERLEQSTMNAKLQFEGEPEGILKQRKRLLRQLFEVARREEAYRNDGQGTSDTLLDFYVGLIGPDAAFAISLVELQDARKTYRRRIEKHRLRRRCSRGWQASERNLGNSSPDDSLLGPRPEPTHDVLPLLARGVSRRLEDHRDYADSLKDSVHIPDSDVCAAVAGALPSAPFSSLTHAPVKFTPHNVVHVPSQSSTRCHSTLTDLTHTPLQPLADESSTQIAGCVMTTPVSMNVVSSAAPPTSGVSSNAGVQSTIPMLNPDACLYYNTFGPGQPGIVYYQSPSLGYCDHWACAPAAVGFVST